MDTMIELELPLAARRQAHASVDASARRAEVLAIFEKNPEGLTADEVAFAIEREPYRVRPRITELYQAGHLKPMGRRRGLHSAVSITVWAVA